MLKHKRWHDTNPTSNLQLQLSCKPCGAQRGEPGLHEWHIGIQTWNSIQ
jgi:hypothetical protein